MPRNASKPRNTKLGKPRKATEVRNVAKPRNIAKSRRPAKPEKQAESLIAEPYTLRLNLDVQNEIEIKPLLSAAQHWHDAIVAVCHAPEDTVIRFHGCDYIFIWPPEMKRKHGTQILSVGVGDDDHSVYAQIVLAPKKSPNQWIRVTYRLYRNAVRKDGAPAYFLECSGNPTTVFAGNNVLPVTTADRNTGAVEPIPSSSRATMLTVNRVLIELLAKLNQQLNPGSVHVDDHFDFRKSAEVRHGAFDLLRIQFCCYLPTPNVQQLLQLLTILYAPLVTEAEGMINIAEHLGLKVRHYTDKKHRITGIQFQWRHGTKLVASLVFYDKRKRVAQMRQGKTLGPNEKSLVQENVRFDITLHKRGINQLIVAARNQLAETRLAAPAFLDELPATEFIGGKPQPTMWWFERAVIVLSHSWSNGEVKRNSFAKWLVARALGDMLRLKSIVKCTPVALNAFIKLPDPVVEAWLKVDKFEAGSWAKHLIELSGLEKSTIYKHRLQLLAAHGIDIAIPYRFYRDLEHFGPKSLAKPEHREALNKALGKIADKEEVWRLLQEGITNFYAQLVDVVGATVNSAPTILRPKIIGKMSDEPTDTPPTEPVSVVTSGKTRPPPGSKARPAKAGVVARKSKRKSPQRTVRGH